MENGRRLENISWRLWYRSCHSKPQQQSNPKTNLIASSLKQPSLLNELQDKQVDNLKMIVDSKKIEPIAQPIPTVPIISEPIAETSFHSNASTLTSRDLKQETESKFFIESDDGSLSPSPLEESKFTQLASSIDQMKLPRTIGYQSEEDLDDYSDYSEDDDDDDDFESFRLPLFQKQQVNPKNPRSVSALPCRRSLLSVALQRCALKRSKPSQFKDLNQQLNTSISMELTESLRQNLICERQMPFNTRIGTQSISFYTTDDPNFW